MSSHGLRCTVSCLVIFILFTIGFSVAQDNAQLTDVAQPERAPKFTISRETTWVTEPVNSQGNIDYFAVINKKYGQGVTRENNAVVMLYRALGPLPDGKRQPDQFYELLGIEPIPDEGHYFENARDWWRRTYDSDRAKVLPFSVQSNAMIESRPWTADEFPELAEWLQAMEEPLARVTDATERTEYFSPLVPQKRGSSHLFLSQLPAVQMARSLARALLARAMLHMGNRDNSRAWSDLMTIHRLGRFVGRGPTVIEGLVGITLESIAIDAELRFLSKVQPNSKFVRRYRKQLGNLPPRALMADKIDHFERACYLDCCQQLLRGRMKIAQISGGNGAKVDLPDEVMEKALVQMKNGDPLLIWGNRWYDRLVATARLPTFRQQEQAFRSLEVELQTLQENGKRMGFLNALTEKTARTDIAASQLFRLMNPGAFWHCIRAENRCSQRFQNLELSLSLCEWKSDHGSYPTTLEALVPGYLPACPPDQFNVPQPLHYEQTQNGYRLYSVGENGIDNQGLTFGEQPGADDLRVTIPFETR